MQKWISAQTANKGKRKQCCSRNSNKKLRLSGHFRCFLGDQFKIFSSMLGFGFEKKSTSSNRFPESGNVTKEEAHDTLLHIEFKIGLLF
jgi:hypothetical protein